MPTTRNETPPGGGTSRARTFPPPPERDAECATCWTRMPANRLTSLLFSGGRRSALPVCDTCHRNYLRECELCRRWVREHQIITTPAGVRACPSCAEMRYARCGQCGEWFVPGEMCPNDCADDDDDDDYEYCTCGCGTRHFRDPGSDDDGGGRINNYSYKPTPKFHGTGPLYLGLEAEVTVSSRRQDRAARTADKFGPVAYLKEDGSVAGFEIVTHPMSYRWAMTEFPWHVFSELETDGCTGDNAGIHVHVSRAGFSSEIHTYLWMKFVYRNQVHVERYAGRRSNQWAPFHETHRADIKWKAKGERGHERYAAINTTNPATFELRIFAGSVDPVMVQGALGFAAATIEYTRTLTAHDVARHDAWSWKAFVRWVSERPEYAPVMTRIERTHA